MYKKALRREVYAVCIHGAQALVNTHLHTFCTDCEVVTIDTLFRVFDRVL
jgi:hypothetical protein